MSHPPTPPPPPPLPPGNLPFATAVTAQSAASTGKVLWWMLWGFLIGSAVSAAVWIPVWMLNSSGDAAALLVLIVPGLKLAVGVIFLCMPGWRAFGGGILLSIAMGFLIFFGACVMYIK